MTDPQERKSLSFGLESQKPIRLPPGWSHVNGYVEWRPNSYLSVIVHKERLYWDVLLAPRGRDGSLVARWLECLFLDHPAVDSDHDDEPDVISVCAGSTRSLQNSAYAAVRAAASFVDSMRMTLDDVVSTLADAEEELKVKLTLSKLQERALARLRASPTGVLHGGDVRGISWKTWDSLVSIGLATFTEPSDTCPYVKLTQDGRRYVAAQAGSRRGPG